MSEAAGTALLGPVEVRELALQAQVRPSKKLGQNFVIDPNTIRKIVQLAGVREGDEVLEVGPGLGSLTLGLLEAGARVTVVEIDSRMARMLPGTVERRLPAASGMLKVVESDALRVDSLPVPPDKVVANLPYNVGVPILLNLLARFPSIASGLVMVQEEVADRLTAQPGTKIYGVPSVKLSWYGQALKAATVGKNVFWPAPNVNSGLVSFIRHPTVGREEERREVFELVDLAFGQRRKTLGGILKGHANPGQLERLRGASPVDLGLRGEALGLEDFVQLARAWRSLRVETGKGQP